MRHIVLVHIKATSKCQQHHIAHISKVYATLLCNHIIITASDWHPSEHATVSRISCQTHNNNNNINNNLSMLPMSLKQEHGFHAAK